MTIVTGAQTRAMASRKSCREICLFMAAPRAVGTDSGGSQVSLGPAVLVVIGHAVLDQRLHGLEPAAALGAFQHLQRALSSRPPA